MKTSKAFLLISSITVVIVLLISCVKELDKDTYEKTVYYGKVIEQSTQKPVPGCRVQITNGKRNYPTEAYTNQDGSFELIVELSNIDSSYYLSLKGGEKCFELKGFGSREYDLGVIEMNNLPSVFTSTVSYIAATTANCGGNVTADGGFEVTARGICWNTLGLPVIDTSQKANNQTVDGAGLGAYSSTMEDLTPNTTYYVRAYARNKMGITYGEQRTFKTQTGNATITTTEVSSITATTAISGGSISTDGGATITKRGICWNQTGGPVITDSHTEDGDGTGTFTSNMTGLTPGKTYFVRAYAKSNLGTTYGSEVTFTTTNGLPVLSTSNAYNITINSANTGGDINNDGGFTVTVRGICWNTSGSPSITDNHKVCGAGTGSFSTSLTNLTPSTTYYVRAYATNSIGTAYGQQIYFSTPNGQAVVSTNAASSITTTSAISGGNITSDGGASITKRGICWNTTGNPTISASHTENGSGIGSFTSNISGLSPSTTYYIRAYATNSVGTTYGSEKMFTTSNGSASITTTSASSITASSAITGGSISADGGATITARGVCYNTSGFPTISGMHTTNGSGTGSFTSQLSGLSPSTIYYVRAYATNSVGTTYGNLITFTTSNGLPSVTTSSATSVTAKTAISGGNITSNGGFAITARGVCWSTSSSPTLSDAHTSNGNGNGSFSSTLTNLSPGTTYYIRAYATNSVGTSYGTPVSFTTQNGNATLTTTSASSITSNSAVSGGYISADGGASITARGVCWNTTGNPTISGSHTENGSGTGSFTSNLNSLSPNTTYYVRAYATNSVKTSYGDTKTFTTADGLPTVTTTAMSNVTVNSLVSGGNVTSNGGFTVTARGVCWSTVPYPTIADNKTTNGSGNGYFSSTVSGINISNTTYYIRAYATNSAGTAYGNQIVVQAGNPQGYPTISYGGYTYVINDNMGTSTASGAQTLCNNITDVFDDWFLPSRDELTFFCMNKTQIGGFTSNYYWTSSYKNVNGTMRYYYVNLSNCSYTYSSTSTGNSNTYLVRCVRKF